MKIYIISILIMGFLLVGCTQTPTNTVIYKDANNNTISYDEYINLTTQEELPISNYTSLNTTELHANFIYNEPELKIVGAQSNITIVLNKSVCHNITCNECINISNCELDCYRCN